MNGARAPSIERPALPAIRMSYPAAARHLPIVVLMAAMALLGAGFVGGGADDGTYILIAQHWAAAGPSLPADHWGGRWPLLLPLALSLKLFGLSRWAIALPSFLAACGCLLLIRRLGDRHFGAPAGIWAAAILAILPPFASAATTASIEPMELLAILAAFALAERPLLAGLMLGLAFQARETSIAALPALLWLARDRRAALMMLAGWAAPLLIEFAAFAALAGDPLYRRHLSLAHTMIRSSELSVRTPSPLFNSEVIRHWRYVPGLHVHWAIDGYLNLLINPALAYLPPLALLLFARDRLSKAAFPLAAAGIYSAILIYALAIDPKPRMFAPGLAAIALAFGALAIRRPDLIAKTCGATIAATALLFSIAQPRATHWQEIGEQWALERPGQIEIAQPGYFIFSPALSQLPSSGRPDLLILKSAQCNEAAPEDTGPISGLPILASSSAGGVAQALGFRWHLCLYRRA